jgi:high-affinity nickel-transport protein
MIRLLATIAPRGKPFDVGLMLTAYGFGFRHGIDWDHIAALTDITSSQDEANRSMLFASLYALGHALVVFALGFAAIVLAERLPSSLDAVMARFVGATLVLLGLYVFVGLLRHGRDFRMRSRWMLLFSGVRRAFLWARGRRLEVIEHDHEHPVDEVHADDVQPALIMTSAGSDRGSRRAARGHRHPHRHSGSVPDDPFLNYGRATAFGIGMIHGIGAETPTQVLIFLAAAGAGGKGVGLLLLACFLVGLLSSNSLIALAGTFGFLGASKSFRLYATVSIVTATFSLVIGAVFLLGHSTVLPAMFGG